MSSITRDNSQSSLTAFISQIIPHTFFFKELCSTDDQIGLPFFSFLCLLFGRGFKRNKCFYVMWIICHLKTRRRRKKRPKYEQLGIEKRKSKEPSSAAAEQQLAGNKQQLSPSAGPRGHQVASDTPHPPHPPPPSPASWIYGSCLAFVSSGVCNLRGRRYKS